MQLIAFCVRYPVTVIVGMILALLFGVIALSRLPIQMTPTVERPEISVETTYLGAAPQEVENEIVDRQEEKLISVQNLQELVSTSSEGRGVVTLRFGWDVNKDVARLEVSEKLDLVQDIPDDAERPIIRAVSSDEETPIAWIVITTTRDINEVRQEAEAMVQVIHQLRERAVFEGQDYGLRLSTDGHRAMRAHSQRRCEESSPAISIRSALVSRLITIAHCDGTPSRGAPSMNTRPSRKGSGPFIFVNSFGICGF